MSKSKKMAKSIMPPRPKAKNFKGTLKALFGLLSEPKAILAMSLFFAVGSAVLVVL